MDDIQTILRCPLDPARLSPLLRIEQEYHCNCGVRFPVKQGLPILIADQADLPDGCKTRHQLPCRKKT
jgi:uncharacterized protein